MNKGKRLYGRLNTTDISTRPISPIKAICQISEVNIMESNKKLPSLVKRRLALFKIFYPLERNVKRKWAKVFNSSFDEIIKRFSAESITMNYKQSQLKNIIFWKNEIDSKIECIFCFIKDVSDLNNVSRIFKYIKRYQPFLTYAIVHQKKDGENTYDIFRFSKFSYLEHCNRVK